MKAKEEEVIRRVQFFTIKGSNELVGQHKAGDVIMAVPVTEQE